MTTRVCAELTCDQCGTQLFIDDYLEVRNYRLAAAARGWKTGAYDLCGACKAGVESPQPQLEGLTC